MAFDHPFVSIESVSMRFGAVEAVRDVSLAVPEGTIFGLVGSDGAGKSTLLRMAATMIAPAEGRITIGSLDVVAQKQAIKAMIGYMPQRFGLYQDLTVDEKSRVFYGHLRNHPKRTQNQRRNISASRTFCPLETARRETSPAE